MSTVPTSSAGLEGSSSQSRLSTKPPRRVEIGSLRSPSRWPSPIRVGKIGRQVCSQPFREACRLVDHRAPVDDIDQPARQTGALAERNQPQCHDGCLPETGGHIDRGGQVGVDEATQQAPLPSKWRMHWSPFFGGQALEDGLQSSLIHGKTRVLAHLGGGRDLAHGHGALVRTCARVRAGPPTRRSARWRLPPGW